MVQLAKFTVGKDWVPMKYGQYFINKLTTVCEPSHTLTTDVEVDFPEELDISSLRASGLQAGEEELPEGDLPQQQPGTRP